MSDPNNPWDQRYAKAGYHYGLAPNEFLAAHVNDLPAGGKLVSLGEGEGRNGVFLAQQGFEVTGVDGSAVGLAKAQALAKERGVTIATIHADLRTFDCGDARWDAIISIWAHLPAELRRELHARLARAVKPGGVILFEHYHPKQVGYGTGGPPDPSWMLTVDELRRDFPGFEVLHAFEGERMVDESEVHRGTSVVTQFIARRRA